MRACTTNPLLWFDGLMLRQAQQNGKTSFFSMLIPFALSVSKGERGVCRTGS
jgi:hypothetical protein